MSTIIPFLQDGGFQPADVQELSAALNEVCAALKLDGDSEAKEVVAARIIELARRGERCATKLRDLVIAEANHGADQERRDNERAEYAKWLSEKMREDAHRAHDQNRAFWQNINDITIKSSDNALRAALLINGGAAISVLAFIGSLTAQGRIAFAQPNDIAGSLMMFALGVAASVGAMALSSFANYATGRHANSFINRWRAPFIRPGPSTNQWAHMKVGLHVAAVIVGLTSLGLFVYGMMGVGASIGHLAIPLATP